jgi:hypothetical protein
MRFQLLRQELCICKEFYLILVIFQDTEFSWNCCARHSATSTSFHKHDNWAKTEIFSAHNCYVIQCKRTTSIQAFKFVRCFGLVLE